MQTVNKYILQTTQETKISNKKEDITVLSMEEDMKVASVGDVGV